MVVALLTRDSVRQALKSGITASQIIDFLRMNAHPEMHKKALATGAPTVVPPTICDQVHLWERERDRISFTEGIAYSQFLSTSDFEMIRDFARDRGYSLWDGDQKKTIVVSKEAHDDVRRFYRKMSKTGQ